MGDESAIPTPTPTRLERFISICERYEVAWKSPHRPRIEDYLADVEARDRLPLLRELIMLECELRLRAGERPEREEYVERFPNDASAVLGAFRGWGASGLPLRAPEPPEIDQSVTSSKGSLTAPAPRGIPTGPLRPPLEAGGCHGGIGPLAGSPALPDADPATIGRYRIDSRLGEGGFGRVFLAWDDELKRTVAIKVPRPNAFSSADGIKLFLDEARMAAQLNHPGIVAVHDIGRQPDGSIYIVLEHVEGRRLSDLIKAGVLSLERMIGLMIRVADAAHHAHKLGLVHRDLKPANILVDSEGNPHITDFGLAVHEDIQRFRSGEVAGTVPYMAPEQVRGETHRLDGRTDVWALGIILYRILAGRRPFSGSLSELLDEIRYRDPKPPRQINDTIPKELERICLKCLAKRMSDRYNSALDLADDLRVFLSTVAPEEATATASPLQFTVGPTIAADPAAAVVESSDSSGQHVHIVPRGLSSFDEGDADFFLELLPGPRDRDGLPESIRFWKTRIDAVDPDKTFRVGLIYGPSGCGKSSLIRAGVIPRAAKRVTAVYVEAAIEDTEARILRAIARAIPDSPHDCSLVDSLFRLRLPGPLEPGRKLLIVLDQFEQWLFGRRDLEASDLVAVLRQCDGERVQAICLVRDDFWMAATRFFRELEIDLVPGHNVAAVDFFDAKHARKVLAAYGRAYGALPERHELSRDQNSFLDQAIAGLTQEGRIVPVRLALLAEMVKAKPWTSSTLHGLGGMDGVGLRFLDEIFSSPRSNPKHRFHQNAAQAVLRALLPEGTTDIKGRMKSFEELRAVSGYEGNPGDFADLVRVLDKELCLITPVDPAISVDEDSHDRPSGGRFYQLAHDYLVHSLREWLTRKRRETRRGRMELLLAERATVWSGKPEDRHLPSPLEWGNIRIWTKPKSWTEAERRMMRRAARIIGLRAVGVAVLTVALCATALEAQRRSNEERRVAHAEGLVQQLLRTDIAGVPDIVQNMRDYRPWIDPRLRQIVSEFNDDSKQKLHASIALLPVDFGQINYLLARVIRAGPAETVVLRESLQPFRSELMDRLWRELRAANPSDPVARDRILPVAGVLESFDPRSKSWAVVSEKIAATVVTSEIGDVTGWLNALWGVRLELTDPLVKIFHNKTRPEIEHTIATKLLARYAEDRPDVLVDLILDAEPKLFSTLLSAVKKNHESALFELKREIVSADEELPGEAPNDRAVLEEKARLRDHRHLRRARAALALIRLGEADDQVWRLLVHSPDPGARSFLINAFQPYDVDSAILVTSLETAIKVAGVSAQGGKPERGSRDSYLFDPSSSTTRALLLGLAGFSKDSLSADARAHLIDLAVGLFRTNPDAGIHSASELLLRRLGCQDDLKADGPAPLAGEPFVRRWYITKEGQTMVLLDGPIQFQMGSSPSDPFRYDEEVNHTRIIPRRFAIAVREVTVDEYQRFAVKSHGIRHKFDEPFTEPKGPQINVSWFDAIPYCNWLSEQEGLRPCYKPNSKGEFTVDMTIDAAAVAAGAYRLPTEAEWEYACRAGTVSFRYFGNTQDLLRHYEWDSENSGFRAKRCGTLLPNDFGLHDMLGNVYELCHDPRWDAPARIPAPIIDQIKDERVSAVARHLRGHSYRDNAKRFRSAARSSFSPDDRESDIGFRVARTCP
jgi:serine/threonine protein kinase/formylglycine-generating enzyme required for sulfatase activity